MTNCERCLAPTNVVTGSWFNLQMICPECAEEESQHPEFLAAKKAEDAAVEKGDFNFQGVGLPEDLALKHSCKCVASRPNWRNRCMECQLPVLDQGVLKPL